ncbi:hypothetical protein MMC30_009008 [Trapelia coarctata]|nr:hypothetical protein [Trapelia coarctata]
MPLLTLHLLRLHPSTEPLSLLRSLSSTPSIDIILASQPRYPVIQPTIIDISPLTSQWHLLLLLHSPNNSGIPFPLRSSITQEYKVIVGIPSKLLSTYQARDKKLLEAASEVKLTGSLDEAKRLIKASGQSLELSADLLRFMEEMEGEEGPRPVTMLNLLSFLPEGKPKYYQYGQAFVEVAGKRGGDAKIVGNVVKLPEDQIDSSGGLGREQEEWWNEISIVHYPSLRAFCDMLAGDDYQEINVKYRLAALQDTMLLCTTEYSLAELSAKARL